MNSTAITVGISPSPIPRSPGFELADCFDATDPESFAATLEKHFGVRRMPAVQGDDDVIRLVSSEPTDGTTHLTQAR